MIKPCSMRAYHTSAFYSALAAILSPVVAAEQSTNKQGLLKPMSSSSVQQQQQQQQVQGDRISSAVSDVLDAADFALGPEPFFDDLFYPAPEIALDLENEIAEDGVEGAGPIQRTTYMVEVYENEARGFGLHWRRLPNTYNSKSGGVRSSISLRWSYKDGSAALPPAEILPPDDWGWVSEWRIDGSGRRDEGGWEYTRELGKFNASRVPRRKKLTDRFRRRRWIRAMQPQRQQLRQGTQDGGLELETLPDTKGVGTPALHSHAHAYECDPGDFGLKLGREMDIDLLPVPDINLRSSRAAIPSSLPRFGRAATAFKGWWTEEFTFRGFGIGVVKPLFRGVLLRPDIGVGIRLPLTLHFRSWEKQEGLPAISASFFVLWPPAVQVSQAISYPAELLQDWATAIVRKILVPSRETFQASQRREAVQRVGVSIGVRYSATYGFQWWLAPYFFLLPGVRVLWHIYEAMTTFLSKMTLMQRSSEMQENFTEPNAREEIMWIVALRYWAAAKTSGLGYSLNYSGSRLGGAVIVYFQPFFLPTYSRGRIPTTEDGNPIVEPVINHDMLKSTVQTEAVESEKDDVNSTVPLGVEEAETLIAADVQLDGDRVREAIPA